MNIYGFARLFWRGKVLLALGIGGVFWSQIKFLQIVAPSGGIFNFDDVVPLLAVPLREGSVLPW